MSVATVSRVLNDTEGARIGVDARQRVHEVARQLGYRPNALAKTLSLGSSQVIGFLGDTSDAPESSGPLMRGAHDEAWRHGYVLLVADTAGSKRAQDAAVVMMLEHKVRGVLYSTCRHREVDLPSALHETDFVLVNCFSADTAALAIVPDEEQGGRTATALLIRAGHRRIAFVNSSTLSPGQSGRLEGYRKALSAARIPFDPTLVFPVRPEQEGGYSVAARVLESAATAVFCHNERVAMGLYDAAKERGVAIPSELAVVSVDEQLVIAAHLRPPLSTVAMPYYELGAAGVRVLLGIDRTPRCARLHVRCPAVSRASVARRQFEANR